MFDFISWLITAVVILVIVVLLFSAVSAFTTMRSAARIRRSAEIVLQNLESYSESTKKAGEVALLELRDILAERHDRQQQEHKDQTQDK